MTRRAVQRLALRRRRTRPHARAPSSERRCILRILQAKPAARGAVSDRPLCYSSVHQLRRPGAPRVARDRGVSTSSEDRWRTTTAPQRALSKNSSYDAQDITVLEGLEAVRQRPGMYIGSTGPRGLHHLVYEVVDNSVDEALAGHCDEVVGRRSTRTTRSPSSTTAAGIPVAIDGEGAAPGGRGRADRAARRRQVRRRRRLQGLRRPARRRRLGRQRAVRAPRRRGPPRRLHVDPDLRARQAARPTSRRGEPTKETGTTITFLPDADIFETLDFDFKTLEERMRETAFLTRGLHITIVDERGEGHRAEFQYEGGIVDFVAYLNENKEPIHKKVISFEGESDEGAVEVAMQWNSSYQESVFSFANNINTHRGRLAPERLPLGADQRAQQVRARQGRAQGEGREPDRRGRARGPDRGHLGQARRSRSSRARPRPSSATRACRASCTRSSTRGWPSSSRRTPRTPGRVIRKAVPGRAGPRRGAQGARPDAPQVGARELDAARQARRLLGQGSGAGRAVRRRGRLGRRLGDQRARPQHAGDPAAARQDPQRREEPDRQGARQHRDPGADHRDRHRRARRVRHREGPLPQGRPADRRRRRRRPHPHAGADAAVPRDAAADRGRLRVHRQAAAVPADAAARSTATSSASPSSRTSCSATSSRSSRSSTATTSSSSSPRRAGSGSRGCSSSTRAGPRRCAPPTATASSRSCSRRGCSRSRSPTSTRCSR